MSLKAGVLGCHCMLQQERVYVSQDRGVKLSLQLHMLTPPQLSYTVIVGQSVIIWVRAHCH